jgi:plasmid stabilization system protein ParE
MASRNAVYRRPLAIADIVSHSENIAVHNLGSALRFLDALESTIDLLSLFPEAGGLVPVRRTELEGLRAKLIVGFSNYILLYFADENIVDIVRVIRGGQDLDSISLDAKWSSGSQNTARCFKTFQIVVISEVSKRMDAVIKLLLFSPTADEHW